MTYYVTDDPNAFITSFLHCDIQYPGDSRTSRKTTSKRSAKVLRARVLPGSGPESRRRHASPAAAAVLT